MKLIIHHHALVYQDELGSWFPSFIGAWLNELSNQFEEIAFIGEQSQIKLENQDYLIQKSNFTFLTIGTRGVNTSKQKKLRIKQLGLEHSSKCSKLVIRGITPRQLLVFKAFSEVPSAFLMVGSLLDSRPKFKFNYISMVVWFLFFIRCRQLKIISKKSMVFANSPLIVHEFKNQMNIFSEFVPTSTLQNSHFKEFSFRGFRKEPVLLFCGRVVKEKGIEELIAAIGRMKRAGRIFKLHIVGSVTNLYKKHLDILIKEEGIIEETVFEGFKKFGDELLSFFKMADIYVLPSYHEGFPHSIWEACSTSTPILTTKVGGIPGLVSEKEVFFCDLKSVSSLINSIDGIISDPDNAKEISHAAFNLARNYSVENCVQIFKDKFDISKVRHSFNKK